MRLLYLRKGIQYRQCRYLCRTLDAVQSGLAVNENTCRCRTCEFPAMKAGRYHCPRRVAFSQQVDSSGHMETCETLDLDFNEIRKLHPLGAR